MRYHLELKIVSYVEYNDTHNRLTFIEPRQIIIIEYRVIYTTIYIGQVLFCNYRAIMATCENCQFYYQLSCSPVSPRTAEANHPPSIVCRPSLSSRALIGPTEMERLSLSFKGLKH